MLLSRKRSRDMEPSLPVLRHPSDRRGDELWLLRDLDDSKRLRAQASDALPTPHSSRSNNGLEQTAERPLRLSRARLSSQELFLSVVMEWQTAAPPAAVHEATSDGYGTASDSSDESESGEQSTTQRRATKRVDEISPTSVHNPPRDLTPLRLDFITSSPVKMIGAYSPRSRQQLLQKYMAKRAKRLSQHKVRYRVRKTLANARPRVKGRFVKTEQP
ncbi:hypothetical protein BBJ28_00024433, partial [Nothophytophthora sp. Chile5]